MFLIQNFEIFKVKIVHWVIPDVFFDQKFENSKFWRRQGQNNSLVPRIEWCSDMKFHEIFGKYDVEFAVYLKISKFILHKTTLYLYGTLYILYQSRVSKIRSRFLKILSRKLNFKFENFYFDIENVIFEGKDTK